MRWRRRRSKVVICGTCSRVLARGQACGIKKRERQQFPDGGWVEWRSWSPCTPALPGGRIAPDGPQLDECADLGDLAGDLNATVV